MTPFPITAVVYVMYAYIRESVYVRIRMLSVAIFFLMEINMYPYTVQIQYTYIFP
jgi:hypothetical protein